MIGGDERQPGFDENAASPDVKRCRAEVAPEGIELRGLGMNAMNAEGSDGENGEEEPSMTSS